MSTRQSQLVIFCAFFVFITLLSMDFYLANLWNSSTKASMFVETFRSFKLRMHEGDLYTEVTVTVENQVCTPVKKIVFAKTHKTAGSTVASIIDRYAFNHQLSAPVNGFVTDISQNVHFNQTSVSAFTELDVFTRHVRYNHKEFDLAIPGAKHVTILRNPVYQFESAFVFYEVAEKLNISTFEKPMEIFFQKPNEYISQRFYRWETVFNHQLFDLGFDTKLSSSQNAVHTKIQQLSNDFDLVLISEYFDESLILLKKLLCWDFENILYLPKNRRSSSSHYQMTSSLVSYVSQWNKADMKLYNHFNKTLWSKIKQYGCCFGKDLKEFRSRLKVVNEKCIGGKKQIYKKRRGDTEFEEYELRSDLSVSDLSFCQGLLKDHSDLYKLLQRDMIARGSIRQ